MRAQPQLQRPPGLALLLQTLFVVVAIVSVSAAAGAAPAAKHPFLGTWKTIGGLWCCEFNADGTCWLGREGEMAKARWKEANDIIPAADPSGKVTLRYRWYNHEGDLTMTMLRPDGPDHGHFVLGHVKRLWH